MLKTFARTVLLVGAIAFLPAASWAQQSPTPKGTKGSASTSTNPSNGQGKAPAADGLASAGTALKKTNTQEAQPSLKDQANAEKKK